MMAYMANTTYYWWVLELTLPYIVAYLKMINMNLNLHYPTYFMAAYLKMMNVYLNLHYPAYFKVAYLNYLAILSH